MSIRSITTLFVIALLFGLTACNTSTQVAEGGIGGTGITTSGQITAFGSIWVNGIEFDTTATSIFIEGAEEVGDDQDLLDECMVVTVIGTVNTDGVSGTADIVEYADELEGIVSDNAVDGSNVGILTVLGQRVTTSATTCFVDSSSSGYTLISQIPNQAIVEVSGFSDGLGNIVATRVEVKAAAWLGEEIELKGVIKSLDVVPGTFRFGDLIVDYATVPAQLDGIPGDILANDLYVEVKSILGVDGGTGYLVASKVELEDSDGDIDIDAEEGEELEIEGVVTDDYVDVLGSDVDYFELNGQVVNVDANTDYNGGGTGDLTVGREVQVHGVVDGSGELLADEIEF